MELGHQNQDYLSRRSQVKATQEEFKKSVARLKGSTINQKTFSNDPEDERREGQALSGRGTSESRPQYISRNQVITDGNDQELKSAPLRSPIMAAQFQPRIRDVSDGSNYHRSTSPINNTSAVAHESRLLSQFPNV
jgi:hypothetical protein